MAAFVLKWTGSGRAARRQARAVLDRCPGAAAGPFGQRAEELAARPARIRNALVASDRDRGPQLAGNLGDEERPFRDGRLVDLSEVCDRLIVEGSGAPDRHRQPLREVAQLDRVVAKPWKSPTISRIELALCVSGSYNEGHVSDLEALNGDVKVTQCRFVPL